MSLQVNRNQAENDSTATSNHLQHLTEYVCCFCLPDAAMVMLLSVDSCQLLLLMKGSAVCRFVVQLET